MKALTTFLFLSIFVFQIHAQDYQIGFAGTGASTSINTVKVENLTQGTSLTLNGTDVLHLLKTLGVNPTKNQNDNSLSIFPNPMIEVCSVEFEAKSSGLTTIAINDVNGKLVVQTRHILQTGRCRFSISDLAYGIYMLNISSDAYCYTGKLISKSTTTGCGIIKHLSSNLQSSLKTNLMNGKSLIPMQFNDGDQLLFKLTSGVYKTVVPIIPAQNTTVTANFVPCTDSDGNNYATVAIDTQVWMAENLNVGTKILDNINQTNNNIIEKYCYKNDDSNCGVYGGLYEWNEAMQYSTTEGVQGICPAGWHLPSDAEWTALTAYLGGEVVVGGKLKEAGIAHWYTPNTGATNSSGFTARPGGYKANMGGFGGLTNDAKIWSSSHTDEPSYAWYRHISYYYEGMSRDTYYKTHGISVRCLQD
jgi:uncharacterized protein (TIGR02145 family)